MNILGFQTNSCVEPGNDRNNGLLNQMDSETSTRSLNNAVPICFKDRLLRQRQDFEGNIYNSTWLNRTQQ